MKKWCFKCRRELPLSEFYRHPQMADGRLGKCKGCAQKDVKANRASKRLHYSEYERKRFQTPSRKAAIATFAKKHKTNNPEKYRARNALSNALRDGRIKRGPCEVCGTIDHVEAHHENYLKPLNVRWLCFRHHREEHGQTPVKDHKAGVWRALMDWQASQ